MCAAQTLTLVFSSIGVMFGKAINAEVYVVCLADGLAPVLGGSSFLGLAHALSGCFRNEVHSADFEGQLLLSMNMNQKLCDLISDNCRCEAFFLFV